MNSTIQRLNRSYKQESEQAAALLRALATQLTKVGLHRPMLLKALAAQVADIDSRFEGGYANWGDHGDLIHINEKLRGLLSGFGGE